jgi:hypothetical protein
MSRYNQPRRDINARMDDALGKPENNSYQRWVLGMREKQPEPTRYKLRKNQYTFVIKIPAFDLRAAKNRIRRLRPALIKTLVAVIAAIVLLFGARYGLRLLNNDRAEDKPNNIAPKEVYVPTNLPDGFSVVGNSQSLENGALLYQVYGPNGQLITITQQVRPADFNMEIFKDAQSFNTPLGKGYIIEDPSRITGYVITVDTMLLFNSTANINNASLQTLMQAFNP